MLRALARSSLPLVLREHRSLLFATTLLSKSDLSSPHDVRPGSGHSTEKRDRKEHIRPIVPSNPVRLPWARKALLTTLSPALFFLIALPAQAQSMGSDPWDNAVNVLKTAFTGPIATGLSLVAIVIGGIMFAFGEGQSKRVFAGIVFGIGMAVGAVNFMAWLFPS